MRPFARFLAAVALIGVAGLAAVSLFVSSPAYCAHSGNYSDASSCFQYDVAGKRVDVLLVGDSSLFHGIRPSIVKAASGLSTYNFGMLGPAFAFDPAAVVDHWLARNPAPKAIVIYISPWHLIHPGRFTDPGWFAYALLVLRHPDWGALAKLVRTKPAVLIEVPQVAGTFTRWNTAMADHSRAEMLASDGHLSLVPPTETARLTAASACDQIAPPVPPVIDGRMAAAIADLRARYGVRGLPVYLYIAPTAACDRAIDLIRRRFAGIADNVPATLPDRLFASGGPQELKHVHVYAEGEEPASRLLARFLTAKIAGAPPA